MRRVCVCVVVVGGGVVDYRVITELSFFFLSPAQPSTYLSEFPLPSLGLFPHPSLHPCPRLFLSLRPSLGPPSHASWDPCMQVRKQQLELDMEERTGSKLGKEYIRLYIVTLLI